MGDRLLTTENGQGGVPLLTDTKIFSLFFGDQKNER